MKTTTPSLVALSAARTDLGTITTWLTLKSCLATAVSRLLRLIVRRAEAVTLTMRMVMAGTGQLAVMLVAKIAIGIAETTVTSGGEQIVNADKMRVRR